jgi:hypothetical protein
MFGTVSYRHDSFGQIFIRRSVVYRNAAAVNAVRFFYDAGNIIGTIRCYGVRKVPAGVVAGKIVQVVNVQTGALATGTTGIPLDDSIPENTEGDEYMTLAITPTDAASKLRIDVVGFWSVNANVWLIAALFQDSTVAALAAFMDLIDTTGDGAPMAFSHFMTAGTTSPTTFKVRAGRATYAGTVTTFNGSGSARYLGGAMASSITITEIAP